MSQKQGCLGDAARWELRAGSPTSGGLKGDVTDPSAVEGQAVAGSSVLLRVMGTLTTRSKKGSVQATGGIQAGSELVVSYLCNPLPALHPGPRYPGDLADEHPGCTRDGAFRTLAQQSRKVPKNSGTCCLPVLTK
ncbi:hypothetical protein UY3_15804 [Chelonia mydas]|uniref:Uncharacterized protein n=1 Tax=Chelonia mydas TaxID=8469 RepID=M7AVN6_CHEMY|nr:hypothetical protein UY3_15804 [Chelonia mydas]